MADPVLPKSRDTSAMRVFARGTRKESLGDGTFELTPVPPAFPTEEAKTWQNERAATVERNKERKRRIKMRKRADLGDKYLTMVLQGSTVQDISKLREVPRHLIKKHIDLALENFMLDSSEKAESFRAMILARMDALLQVVWGTAMSGELNHIDAAMAIMTKQAKLAGLERVTHDHKHKVDGTVKHIPIESSIPNDLSVEQWELRYRTVARIRAEEANRILLGERASNASVSHEADSEVVEGQILDSTEDTSHSK